MKKATLLFVTLIGFIGAGFAEDNVNVSGKSGFALNGYDPVAFFTDKKATNGDPSITAKHKGATYMFTSKGNRKMFEANPEAYAPQYGGYCAYGVAVGALFPIDITTWQVRDDKLYVNLNHDILKVFNKDLEKNIKNADMKWPALSK